MAKDTLHPSAENHRCDKGYPRGTNVAKPAGVRMVRRGEQGAFVEPLACRKWPGIGPVAEQRLQDSDIHTLGQLLEVIRKVPLGRTRCLCASCRFRAGGQ